MNIRTVIIALTIFSTLRTINSTTQKTQKKCTLQGLAGEQPHTTCMLESFLATLPKYNARRKVTPYRNTYLFHGYPGTGKTTGTISLATRAHAIFIPYKVGNLVAKHPQDLYDAIKEIYQNAQKEVESTRRPVIIFFDDLKEYHKDAIDFINTYLQNSSDNPYIITIVATNRELKSFDEDFKSRCTPVLWEMPDKEKRGEIIRYYIRKYNAPYDRNLIDNLAKKSAGFTGRYIEESFQNASNMAIDQKSKIVNKEYVYQAFKEKQDYIDLARSNLGIFWLWITRKRF